MNDVELLGVGRSRACNRAQWLGHVSAQVSSGQTAADYCREQGLHPKSFYRWKRVLWKSGDLDELLGGPRPVDSLESGAKLPFVELRLAAGMTGPEASGVEVALGRGSVVRVARNFDVETLQRVVLALEEGRC